ncbi:MAG: GntR family transcriptional regulator [Bacillota bacterium]
MSICKAGPIPLYEQLADSLRARVESGEYPPGYRLPSQKELADEFSISVITVRQAVSQLEDAGLLVRKQGKGTFVRDGQVTHSLRGLQSLTEVLEASGLRPEVVIDEFAIGMPPDHVRDELHLGPDDKVLAVKRRHLVEDEAIACALIYIPERIAAFLTRDDLERYPVYTLYEQKLGIRLGSAKQRIRAVSASRPVARSLGIREGDPTLHAEWVARDEQGQPVEKISFFYRADKYEFVAEVQRSGSRETFSLCQSVPALI